jgi:uncharacterized membrane protein YqaE (UPF0057 family)
LAVGGERRLPGRGTSAAFCRCLSGQRVVRTRRRFAPSVRLAPETRMDLLRIILSVLLPPLGVFLQVGIGLHFWLNILLTILGYIPGIVHAVWIIARR